MEGADASITDFATSISRILNYFQELCNYPFSYLNMTGGTMLTAYFTVRYVLRNVIFVVEIYSL